LQAGTFIKGVLWDVAKLRTQLKSQEFDIRILETVRTKVLERRRQTGAAWTD
jgi:hypothetical protein